MAGLTFNLFIIRGTIEPTIVAILNVHKMETPTMTASRILPS